MLLAVCEAYGIQSELIPKIATGFCGGISRSCGMCGAVSGGIMALGLFTGRTAPDQSVMESYTASQKLMKNFEGTFGSTNCRDLTGVDLGTDEGQKKFKEDNIKERCKVYTGEATKMAVGLLEERRKAGRL
ncbi:MAG: C_GCAxxG_C_C family protein [Desulfomonile tiedjei]|nr:C_GCAxxG_C_C family protein [Desulfomonile tiedjei]